MTGRDSIEGTLTNADVRQAVFLTLAFVLSFVTHFSHAETIQDPNSIDNKNHISQIETYIRNESLNGLSLLPGNVRAAASWFSGWHQLHTFEDSDTEEPMDAANKTAVSESNNGLSLPLSTSVHHKGFLPTHDAMMLGVGAHESFLDNKLQLTARPFYGQSWRSLNSYWGGEMALDLARQPDGMPFGKISIGYISGDEAMTDHGRGIDLHGDIDLTSHFSLTTGIRQNSVTGNANYGMLQWKISFGGNP